MKRQIKLTQEEKRQKLKYLERKKGRLEAQDAHLDALTKSIGAITLNLNNLITNVRVMQVFLLRQTMVCDAVIKKGLVTQSEINQVLIEAEWNHYQKGQG